MIAYAFRFLGEEDQPTGWAGFAFAQNMRDLFWQIDEHGDPYSCHIKTLRRGSACFQLDDNEDISKPEIDIDFIVNNRPWKKPNWKNIHEK
jgi:hypothetical protein